MPSRATRRREEKVEKVRKEVEAVTPKIAETDISAPPEIELAVAARWRQQLRNDTLQLSLAMKLAKKRHAGEEAKGWAKQFDNKVLDITELDALYPKAQQLMSEMDKVVSDSNREAA